jgi:hypothetical protein
VDPHVLFEESADEADGTLALALSRQPDRTDLPHPVPDDGGAGRAIRRSRTHPGSMRLVRVEDDFVDTTPGVFNPPAHA